VDEENRVLDKRTGSFAGSGRVRGASESPDSHKRGVVCLIGAAIPDQHATSKDIAHRAHSQIRTALYRAYLQRLLPLLPATREQIAERPMMPPDLLEVSPTVLRDLTAGCLGNARVDDTSYRQ
jgi:hypothetical protein